MKVAIFSDVHGNKEALKAIINDIKKNNIDEIICLGDVIGIGPNPKECMDIIIDNNIEMVLGNHELYFLKGTEIDDEIKEEELNHHRWVKEQLNDRHRQYLEKCNLTLEKEYGNKKVLLGHFLIDNNSKDNYPFYGFNIINDGSIKDIVKELNYDLLFVGHEHKEFIVDNKLYDVGSSGCRKDNITRYTVLDTDSFEVETKNIEFNREQFEKDLLEREYPDRDPIANWFFGTNF